MKLHFAVVAGDGIGPEITKEAIRVLDKVAEVYGHEFEYEYLLAGGCSIDAYGKPLTEEVLEKCKASDSVILGAVGGPKWDNIPGVRPEQALLGLREGLGLFANLRPATIYKELADACPLKPEYVPDGLDILIVRELTGGIYFGESGTDGDTAYDTEKYSVYEIERVMKVAIDAALKRNKRLTVVHKANVMESSRLWKKVAHRMIADYPEITMDEMYIDNAAMQLIRNPAHFDVIVTGNMFGDILSDEASQLTGSIGMLPSASLGATSCGMYEPIHGSAPDIAGKGIANPLATILSMAMMLRHSFGLMKEADAIENAVQKALADGLRTADIAKEGEKVLSTSKMGDAVVARIS